MAGTARPAPPRLHADWRDIGEVRHTFTHFHLILGVLVAHVPRHLHALRGEFLGANLFSPQDLPTLMRKAHDLAFAPPPDGVNQWPLIAPAEVARLQNALPFWLSLGTLPMALLGMAWGGWAVFLMPLYTWGLYALLDALLGLNTDNADLADQRG